MRDRHGDCHTRRGSPVIRDVGEPAGGPLGLMGRQSLASVPTAVAVVSLVLVPDAMGACADADLQPTASNLRRVEAAMICLLNGARVAQDRAPVHRERRLERSAARHTRDMTTRGYFAHRRRGGPTVLGRIRSSGYFEGARSGLYSENLGYAPPERATAASMHRAFSLSESHSKTMLYSRFRDIGIGTTIVDPQPAFYPEYPAVVFTIDFGRRYERRRRRCRTGEAVTSADDSRKRALPPRRWCRRRTAR